MKPCHKIVRAIEASGISIYDSLQEHPQWFLSTAALESILDAGLKGLVLDQPLRTRSKILKARVCRLLGYPEPERFKRTRPRFPGQNFDAYVQKSNNLQIWNEEIFASRRYAIVRVDERNVVTAVRVLTGKELAIYDRTGTLTRKYQAKAIEAPAGSRLASAFDTPAVTRMLVASPSPAWPNFLPIGRLHDKLRDLIGATLIDPGATQDRKRGGVLHRAVCQTLGAPTSRDDGQFPDIKEQLLEVKLQTSPTIDLGLVRPDSGDPLDNLPSFRHCDVRYAIFFAKLGPHGARIDHLVLCTGADFFDHFRLFGGLDRNTKLQIPLPAELFS